MIGPIIKKFVYPAPIWKLTDVNDCKILDVPSFWYELTLILKKDKRLANPNSDTPRGTKYIKLLFLILNKCVPANSKASITKNKKREKAILNNAQNIKRTSASSSESHKGIALSYLSVAKTPKNWIKADKIDKSAKSSGEYSLVINGVPTKIINWARNEVNERVIVDL